MREILERIKELDEVLNTKYGVPNIEFIKTKVRELNEIAEETLGELYVVVCWPDSQDLMDKEGWEENSMLINDEHGLETYGSSAYLVCSKWLSINT